MTHAIAYQRQINANFARKQASSLIAKKIAVFMAILVCLVVAIQL